MESLAALVARSGPAVEQVARKQAAAAAAAAAGAGEGAGGTAGLPARVKYEFLVTGEGMAYYLWRLHKIRVGSALQGGT